MKKAHTLFLLVICQHCFSQCPFALTLKRNGSICLGSDTLVVTAPGSTLSKIVWYNGTAVFKVVNAGSTPIGTTVAGGNGGGTKGNQLQYPTGIYRDAVGNTYVADAANERIQKFPAGSTNATVAVTVAGGNLAGKAANQFSNPSGVFVDAGGSIYVADEQNHRIQQFPPYSSSTTQGTTVAGGKDSGSTANLLKYPSSVYVDGSGYIYVADNGNNRIQKFRPGQPDAVTVAGGNGYGAAANQLNSPAAVFVDGQANIYVADLGNNRIQKFPPGSTSSSNGITVAGGKGLGTAPDQLAQPSSVFVDAAGTLYVADKLNGRVQKFPPNSTSGTNATTVAGGNGLGPAANQLDNPDGVFIDATGNIYVADDANNRIQQFMPGGINVIDSLLVTAAPGKYRAVVTNSAGCTDTTNAVVISPAAKATIRISTDTTTFCAGNPITLTALAANAGNAPLYQWLVNGMAQATNSPVYTTAALSNGDVITCVVSNTASCILPDTSNNITAHTFPRPLVGPANDVTITPGQTITLGLPVTGDITTYTWNPPIGLDKTYVASPVASPEKTTTYSLMVQSADGCTATGNIKVIVAYPIMVPGAFTPNGDGHNDIFYVLGGYPGDILKDFTVFGRWGQRLFHVQHVAPNDPVQGWDGTVNGQPQQPGTYVYVIAISFADGSEKVFKGTVVLVR